MTPLFHFQQYAKLEKLKIIPYKAARQAGYNIALNAFKSRTEVLINLMIFQNKPGRLS